MNGMELKRNEFCFFQKINGQLFGIINNKNEKKKKNCVNKRK